MMIRLKIILPFLILGLPALAQEKEPIELNSKNSIIRIEGDSIEWYDVRKGSFELVGFEWIGKDSIFRRLPVNPEWEIRKPVDNLANNTAGGQVRFITNSREVLVNVELQNQSNMYHMPATGQSGFDLYVGNDSNPTYSKTTRFHVDSVRYQSLLFKNNEKKQRTFVLNFPLYNGVRKLELGLEKGSEIKPYPFAKSGKIVIYGTSITQGGCVSRPGMAYSNILSRELDVQFVNLGFSGNGKGEPALAKLINQIPDISMIILDYEANVGEKIVNTLATFIEILREKHPETPILVVSKIRYSREVNDSKGYQILISNRDFQDQLVKKRRAKGDKNIYFLDGSEILGSNFYECTVDGVHPNDLGSRRMANALAKKIKKIEPLLR